MNLRFDVHRVANGYECIVRIGEFTIGSTSEDAAGALNAASGLASDLTAVMRENPELAALMPPQATAALKAIRLAAWAVRNKRIPKGTSKHALTVVKSILSRVK